MRLFFLAGALMTFLGLYLSISLMWIGLSIFFLSGVLLGIQTKNFSWLTRNPFFLPVFILAVAMALSVILANPYPFKGAIGKIALPFSLFLFAWCFEEFPEAKKYLLNLSLALSFLILLVTASQRYGVFQALAPGLSRFLYYVPNDPNHYLPVGFTRHHTTLAFSLIFLFHVLLGQFLLLKNPRNRIVLVLGCACCVVGILFSFSRGAWLSLLLSTGLVVWLGNRKLFLKTFSFTAFLCWGLYLAIPEFRARLFSFRFSENRERFELWQIGWRMFQDSPWFGQGYDSFGSRVSQFSDLPIRSPQTPLDLHNMYLEFLATSGLIGFLCLLFFLGSASRLVWKDSKSPWSLAGVGVLASFCVGGFFDRYFDMPHTLIPVLLLLGLCTNQTPKTPMAGPPEV